MVKFPVEDRYAHSSENEAHVTEGGLMTEEDVTFRYTSEIFAHRGGGELSRRIEEDLFLYYADGHLRRSLWKFHFGNGHRLSICKIINVSPSSKYSPKLNSNTTEIHYKKTLPSPALQSIL